MTHFTKLIKGLQDALKLAEQMELEAVKEKPVEDDNFKLGKALSEGMKDDGQKSNKAT